MNPAPFRNLLRREPMPRAAVLGVIDAFDRCDPTRSHEEKPSTRMRELRHTRRLLRALFNVALGTCVVFALVLSFAH